MSILQAQELWLAALPTTSTVKLRYVRVLQGACALSTSEHQGVQRVSYVLQGNAAATADDTQAKASSEAPANNYTAQYTVYTQRAKSLADEVRFSCRRFT